MENFPPNSKRPRTEPAAPKPEKKIERVTTSEPIRRKKPLGSLFMDTFFTGSAEGVFGYVLQDVILPAAKDTVADAVSQGIERLLFGETNPRRRAPSRRGGSQPINYNRYYSPTSPQRDPREEVRPSLSRRARATHDFDEIILQSRIEAEETLEGLYNLLEKYNMATVADLYELVGISGKFTDEKYGWTDLRGTSVSRTSHGYLLNLPKPEALD